jgi:hypothetical protein
VFRVPHRAEQAAQHGRPLGDGVAPQLHGVQRVVGDAERNLWWKIVGSNPAVWLRVFIYTYILVWNLILLWKFGEKLTILKDYLKRAGFCFKMKGGKCNWKNEWRQAHYLRKFVLSNLTHWICQFGRFG